MEMKPSGSRRNVILDIKTITANPLESGGRSALVGRIVGINILIDNGIEITEEKLVNEHEGPLLRQFWDCIRPNDLFIGLSVTEVDLSLVRQRSWAAGIRPSQDFDLPHFYSHDTVDILHMRPESAYTTLPILDGLYVLGSQGKETDGKGVEEWPVPETFGNNIACSRLTVRDIFEAFCKLSFQEIPERYYRSVT